MNRYKVTYTTMGTDFNIRFVKAADICTALREFKSEFPEADICEMIEV